MARSAKEIAEQAMQGWKAVEVPARDSSAAPPEADQVGKDIASLKRTYVGDSEPATERRKGSRAAARPESEAAHTKMVVMEPERPADAGTSRKVVLVREDEDEATGFQG